MPQEICDIDDELKAIYHSKDTVCIWVFKTRDKRNKFMGETIGMNKDERDTHIAKNYGWAVVILNSFPCPKSNIV